MLPLLTNGPGEYVRDMPAMIKFDYSIFPDSRDAANWC